MKPSSPALRSDASGKLAADVELRRDGLHFPLREVAGGFLDHELLFGEREVHGGSPGKTR
jgi:hypothetical protein